MTKKRFDAILAKNDIAREIKQLRNNQEPISSNVIIYALETIEQFLGEGNQPSINDILNTTVEI
jgi:hypothetical protein